MATRKDSKARGPPQNSGAAYSSSIVFPPMKGIDAVTQEDYVDGIAFSKEANSRRSHTQFSGLAKNRDLPEHFHSEARQLTLIRVV